MDSFILLLELVPCTDPALWAVHLFVFNYVQTACGALGVTEAVSSRYLRAMSVREEGSDLNDELLRFDYGQLLPIVISL